MLTPRAQRDFIAVLGVCAVVLLFWNPLLWPNHIYPSGDLTNLFWPQRIHLSRSFAEGSVPLWNRFTWCGSPFLASMQPGVFDWTAWPFLRSHGDPVVLLAGFNRQRMILFLVLAITTFTLARGGLRLSRGSAALAAVVASCSGFLWGQFDHVNQLSAMAWYPLVLFGALRALQGAGLRASLVIGTAVALQIFGGHPQHVVLGAMATGVVTLGALLVRRRSWHLWLCGIAAIALGYVLGALLSAIQWLPSLELSRLSEHLFDRPEFAASFSMRWSHLLRLIWPFAFGVFPNYTTTDNFSELGVFVGRVPLALALIALVALAARLPTLRSASKEGGRAAGAFTLPALVAIFSLLALLSLFWALGSNGPIFEPLLRVIPPLRSFRVPPRTLFYFDLSLGVLAALGLEALRPIIADADRPPLPGSAKGSLRTRVVSSSLIVLTLLDLWAASRADYFRHPCPRQAAEVVSPVVGQITSRDADQPRLYRLQRNDTDYYIDPRPPALARRLIRLQPNMGLLWGIGDIEGYTEGLLPTARWRDFLGHINRNLRQRRPDAELLGLMGVRWVLTETSSTPIEPDPLIVADEFQDPGDDPPRLYTLFENPRALPPVVPLAALEALAPPENLEGPWSRGLAREPVTRLQAVPIARPGATWPEPEALPRFRAEWRGPNSLVISNAGQFVGDAALIQAAYPGWVAQDGLSPRRRLRVLNAVWSAWSVAPGASEITLRFEPETYRVGLFTTALALLILSSAAARLAAGSSAGRRAPAPAPAARSDRDTH